MNAQGLILAKEAFMAPVAPSGVGVVQPMHTVEQDAKLASVSVEVS